MKKITFIGFSLIVIITIFLYFGYSFFKEYETNKQILSLIDNLLNPLFDADAYNERKVLLLNQNQILNEYSFKECTGNTCVLRRKFVNELDFQKNLIGNNFCIRNDFESELINAIKMNFPDRGKTLRYCSLGSGELLGDIIILCALFHNGYDFFELHLIDPIYKKNDIVIKNLEKFISAYNKAKHDHIDVKIFSYDSVDNFTENYKSEIDILVAMDALSSEKFSKVMFKNLDYAECFFDDIVVTSDYIFYDSYITLLQKYLADNAITALLCASRNCNALSLIGKVNQAEKSIMCDEVKLYEYDRKEPSDKILKEMIVCRIKKLKIKNYLNELSQYSFNF